MWAADRSCIPSIPSTVIKSGFPSWTSLKNTARPINRFISSSITTRRTSTIPHPLHSHQRLLAQSGGASVWGGDPEVSVASIRGNRCRLGTRHYSVLGTAQSDPPAISVESDPDPDPAKSEARLEVSARPLRSQEALCRPGQHRAPPRLARRCCRTDLTGLSSPVIVLFQKPGPQVATRRFAFREPCRHPCRPIA